MRPITARPARFRQKHCKPYTLCKALYQHGPPLAGDGAGVLHSDCRESDRERKSKSNGSSPEEEAEPMSKAKSLSLPVQSTPKNPNAAPAIKELQKTTVSRERDAPGGRHRGRAIACDERRCADAIRNDEQAEHGGRADARQDIHPGGRPSRYWERGRRRRAILRPGFSLAINFLGR